MLFVNDGDDVFNTMNSCQNYIRKLKHYPPCTFITLRPHKTPTSIYQTALLKLKVKIISFERKVLEKLKIVSIAKKKSQVFTFALMMLI